MDDLAEALAQWAWTHNNDLSGHDRRVLDETILLITRIDDTPELDYVEKEYLAAIKVVSDLDSNAASALAAGLEDYRRGKNGG